jgi:regulator of protease activity HflC (stomatin/prohibitin superfamily)
MSQKFISIKIDNFSNKPIKVNDKRGNPLELSCMFAWRVSDAAKAMFSVEDYDEFIKNQVEGILAQIASLHPYDSEESNEISFRKNISDISQNLKEMLQKRVQECGLEIVDVRFNHFAYAVEIAASMLKKQQAEAMIDARRKIVEGAQKMVEELIKEMDKGEVQFSNEDKVRLATNLMTVLVSENGTQPVVRV